MTKPKGRRKRIDRGPKLSGSLPLGHPGRPTKFDETLNPRIKRLAMLGMTDLEIAHHLGIDEKTFHSWKAKYPSFLQSLEDGKINADAEVAETLFNLATGRVRQPALKVFLGEDDTPVYAPYAQVVPPSVAAAKLWLLNRQPQRWRDKREVEVSGTLEHRIAQMTPAERLQRLKELQAKANELVIEAEVVEVEPDGG